MLPTVALTLSDTDSMDTAALAWPHSRPSIRQQEEATVLFSVIMVSALSIRNGVLRSERSLPHRPCAGNRPAGKRPWQDRVCASHVAMAVSACVRSRIFPAVARPTSNFTKFDAARAWPGCRRLAVQQARRQDQAVPCRRQRSLPAMAECKNAHEAACQF
jgi:hypothetical protein